MITRRRHYTIRRACSAPASLCPPYHTEMPRSRDLLAVMTMLADYCDIIHQLKAPKAADTRVPSYRIYAMPRRSASASHSAVGLFISIAATMIRDCRMMLDAPGRRRERVLEIIDATLLPQYFHSLSGPDSLRILLAPASLSPLGRLSLVADGEHIVAVGLGLHTRCFIPA